ncbi:MAG: hypothetical protein K2Q06_15635, partial [Parvularculaceae bacterium]|nr:hypothetical protein [Parvularculaceae bacterium]
EDVRGEIAAELGKDSGRKALLAAIEKLRSAQDTGASLAEAAREAGAPAKTWGPVDDKSFAPGGAIIADIPGEVLAEAFKTDQGLDTDATELRDDSGYFFLHVDTVKDAAIRPYKDVAAEVEQRWKADEAKTRLERAAKKIRDAVAAGKTLDAEAAAFSKTPIVVTIPRNATSEALSPDFVKSVFKATKGSVVTSPVSLGRGQVVAQIRNITYARDRVTPQDEAQFGEFVDAQMNRELTEAYIESLRKDAKIAVNQTAIDAAFGEPAQ